MKKASKAVMSEVMARNLAKIELEANKKNRVYSTFYCEYMDIGFEDWSTDPDVFPTLRKYQNRSQMWKELCSGKHIIKGKTTNKGEITLSERDKWFEDNEAFYSDSWIDQSYEAFMYGDRTVEDLAKLGITV